MRERDREKTAGKEREVMQRVIIRWKMRSSLPSLFPSFIFSYSSFRHVFQGLEFFLPLFLFSFSLPESIPLSFKVQGRETLLSLIVTCNNHPVITDETFPQVNKLFSSSFLLLFFHETIRSQSKREGKEDSEREREPEKDRELNAIEWEKRSKKVSLLVTNETNLFCILKYFPRYLFKCSIPLKFIQPFFLSSLKK